MLPLFYGLSAWNKDWLDTTEHVSKLAWALSVYLSEVLRSGLNLKWERITQNIVRTAFCGSAAQSFEQLQLMSLWFQFTVLRLISLCVFVLVFSYIV